MKNIPVILLFVITMAANLTGSIVRTCYSKKISSTAEGYHLFNAGSSLVCGITLLILSGGNFSISPYTIIMAVLFGIITALQQITNSAALSVGPLSYTSVIISMSTVITALSGALFFDETIRPTQLAGIVLMIICLILSVRKDKNDKKTNIRWFVLSLLSSLCCGGVGIMQKIHQTSDHRSELTMFLIIAFMCSFVFSGINLIISKTKGRKIPFPGKSLLIPAFLVAGGIGIALNNLINLYLSGIVDSAVFFPVVNGGGLILVTIASLIIFKEKLTAKQWVGMATGIGATLFLCL